MRGVICPKGDTTLFTHTDIDFFINETVKSGTYRHNILPTGKSKATYSSGLLCSRIDTSAVVGAEQRRRGRFTTTPRAHLLKSHNFTSLGRWRITIQ